MHATPALLDHGIELARDNGHRLPRLALGKRLTEAQDRYQPGLLRRHELGRDSGIALTEQLAPLGMPDQHIAATEIAEHRRRYLAGKCAGSVLADRLGAPQQGSSGQLRLDLGEVGIRHAYRNLALTTSMLPPSGDRAKLHFPEDCRASSSFRRQAFYAYEGQFRWQKRPDYSHPGGLWSRMRADSMISWPLHVPPSPDPRQLRGLPWHLHLRP